MATVTANVTVNDATYTALSSGSNAVKVFIRRGQVLRISAGAGAPGDNDTAVYALLTGPSSNGDGSMLAHDFTLSGANIYARLEHGGTVVTVMTT